MDGVTTDKQETIARVIRIYTDGNWLKVARKLEENM